ncbi:Tfp pilus assembly protein PilP [Psychrobacter sp. PL19]
MKSLIKTNVIMMSCLILLGCSPCKLGDWNCSEINSQLSKNVNECNSTQQAAARSFLGSQYTDKVRTNILNSCIDNTNYKFKTSN